MTFGSEQVINKHWVMTESLNVNCCELAINNQCVITEQLNDILVRNGHKHSLGHYGDFYDIRL